MFCVLNNKLLALQRKISLLHLIVVLTIIFTLLITLTNSWCNLYSKLEEDAIQRDKFTKLFQKIIYNNEDMSYNKQRVILSAKEIENKKEEQNMRKKKIRNVCQTLNNEFSQLDTTLFNIIIDTKHSISWCPVYKAASSMWMRHFAVLGGVLTDSTMNLINRNIVQINNIVRQAFPRDLDFNATIKRLHQTTRFMIVRHPLERLLSAYRDKLEHIDGREYYYKRFGRHIVHRYRLHKKINHTRLEPTFEEFLQFIVNEKYFDEHWAPYYDTCKPCIIHYDYILKFETFDKDETFFIEETGLRDYLYQKYNMTNSNPYGPTTKSLLKEYIKDIPRLLLKQIYNIYEKDFKLFSYLPM